MDVVPDAGAVGRRIVGAEDFDVLAFALGDLQNQGDEVRLGVMAFPQLAFRIGAGGVEVAEDAVVHAVGLAEIVEDQLDHALRPAVGVQGGDRRVFADGDFLDVAVGRAGGGEDEVVDAEVAAGGDERQRLSHVVLVIHVGVLDTFTDGRESGKMHHSFDLVLSEDLFQNSSVTNVAFVKIRGHDRVAKTARQVVKYGYLVTFCHKTFHTMTANVAGSTGKKDHIFSFLVARMTQSRHPQIRSFIFSKFFFASSFNPGASRISCSLCGKGWRNLMSMSL